MSRVYLMAADKPLPLCDKQEERTSVVTVEGEGISISFLRGFAVREHIYYRNAVDHLELAMKPCLYELEVEAHPQDLVHFKTYLTEHFSPGETVELWSLWVGADDSGPPVNDSVTLNEFDMDTLTQFLDPLHQSAGIGQCRFTITI